MPVDTEWVSAGGPCVPVGTAEWVCAGDKAHGDLPGSTTDMSVINRVNCMHRKQGGCQETDKSSY